MQYSLPLYLEVNSISNREKSGLSTHKSTTYKCMFEMQALGGTWQMMAEK